MYRTAHLFSEAIEHEDEPNEGASPSNGSIVKHREVKAPIVNYPSIAEDKVHLNSLLTDPDASDIISLSCFSRPIARTAKI